MGAVKHCQYIETTYKNVLPEIQLGAKISEESPVAFGGAWKKFFWFIRDSRFRNATSKLHSDAKIEVLYKSVICTMLFVVFLYALFGGIQFNGHSPASILIACFGAKA